MGKGMRVYQATPWFRQRTSPWGRHPVLLAVVGSFLLAALVITGSIAAHNSRLGGGPPPVVAATPDPTESPATVERGGAGVPQPAVGFVEVVENHDPLFVLAAGDRKDVRSLVAGTWLPQVSSKCAGLTSVDTADSSGRWAYPDGVPESYPDGISDIDIARFHEALIERYEDVLLTREQRTEGPCEGRDVWVSMVRGAYATQDEAQSWCDRQLLPERECLARQVTQDLLDASRQQPLVLSTGLSDFGLQVPSSMSAHVEDGAVVGRDSVAELRITAFESVRGEVPPSFDETVQRWLAEGAPPTDDSRFGSGYRVTGFTDDDEVYFVRLFQGQDNALLMEWRYPADQKDRYDAAVEISVDSLYEAD